MSLEESFRELPVLNTDRLILRQITNSENDGRDSLEFINDYSVYRFWGLYDESQDPEGTRRPKKKVRIDYHYQETLKEYRANRELTWLMELKETGRVIGEIVIYDIKLMKQADIGYRISKKYWGQGFASEAGQAIVDFAFKELKLDRLQIRCFKDNQGSIRIAEKLGFRQEGLIRNGVILQVMTDYYIFGLLREEYNEAISLSAAELH